jgi:hypothetical protein
VPEVCPLLPLEPVDVRLVVPDDAPDDEAPDEPLDVPDEQPEDPPDVPNNDATDR